MGSPRSSRRSRRLATGRQAPITLALLTLSVLGIGGGICSAQPFAYVTNNQSLTVSVINTATNQVVATIPAGFGPVGVAVSPNGQVVYITNSSDTVQVIDATANRVIRTVTVGLQPWDVAILPSGAFAYVANSVSRSISVIETFGNTVVATVPLSRTPRRIAVSPDGSRVYTANADGTVSVIASASNTLVTTIPLGGPAVGPPEALVVARDGSRVYVADGSQGLAIISTATNAVVGRLPIPTYALTIAPDGSRLYAVTNTANTIALSVIDTATLGIVSAVTGIIAGVDVAITPDGSRVYIAQTRTPFVIFNTVMAIDTRTNSIVATIPVGNLPGRIAIAPAAPGSSPGGVPGQPTNVVVTPTGNTLNVSWNAPGSGASPTGYRLNFYAGTTPVATVNLGPATSAAIPVPPGAQGAFAVTVTALAGAASGTPSASVSFVLGNVCSAAPPAPIGVSGFVAGGVATVQWSPSPGASNYIVQAGAIQGNAELFNQSIGNLTRISAAGVPAGFTAWVRIIAENACGRSAGADVLVR